MLQKDAFKEFRILLHINDQHQYMAKQNMWNFGMLTLPLTPRKRDGTSVMKRTVFITRTQTAKHYTLT